jgi:acetolactate synthase-1/2/3 large subunit
MLGSELVIGALKRRGVTTIFSLSGNQIMPLYDACIDAGIRIVHVRHEAAAVFMADGWAQATGQIGVAMLTAGPGITNGVAPLYSAAQAESPVLLLAGDSSVAEDGLGAFQEMDQCAITRPLTKRSTRPLTHAALATAVDDAIALALAPRRGPVHVALPFDLLCAESGIAALPPPAALSAPAIDDGAVATVARLLAAAQRPVLLAGPSAARMDVAAAWRDLAARLDLPLRTMESPRGLKDPSAGAFAEALARSDLVILAGKALDFTLGFGKAFAADTRFVAVDPDPGLLERARKRLGPRLVETCAGEPRAFLEQVAAHGSPGTRAQWRSMVDAAVATRALRESEGAPEPADRALPPRTLCEAVQRIVETVPDPIVVCDGGEFGQWAQAFCRAPLRIINGPSGAIGGGLCYAIAAKLARPDATVIALMGDGTAGFHFMEFDTAVREGVAFVAVIGNDLRWNAEHLIQLRTYGPDRTIGCTLAATARYHEVARALGGFGAASQGADDVEPMLRAALASGLPACLDVAIDGQAAPVFTTTATRAAH